MLLRMRSVDKHVANGNVCLGRIGKHVEKKEGQGLPMQRKEIRSQEPRSLGGDRMTSFGQSLLSIGPLVPTYSIRASVCEAQLSLL